MSDLGPNTRALLSQARDADAAEMDASRARVRGALGRKLGVVAVGIAATTASTAGAGTTASVGMGLLGKAMLGLAALTITAGGVAVARRAPTPRPVSVEPRAAASGVSVAAPHPAAIAAPVTTPSTNDAPIADKTNVKPPTHSPAVVAPTVVAPPVVAPTVVAPAVVAPAASSLNDELVALRRANDAIAAGKHAEALSILDAAPKNGTLAEERTGLRLLARCGLGHSDARIAAKSFLASHPSSPLSSRLRVACAEF